ncbi:site-specific DNA-methyltransferase [Candidatus Atribacteria bacterium 1244-E10-H5-B2]|nr:MAG: site-specific DNA-methyltransferase [Candidatus Atribacteria bacterium 1244-E10-H5-B2]
MPKASKTEKNRGCEKLEEKVRANINKMMGEAGNFKTGSGNVRTVKFKNHHPTVKPIKLMSYLIILGSRPNDIILDPFVGSGTTCIAAKMLKRRYIGFDNDKEYIEIAQCRLGAVEAVLI